MEKNIWIQSTLVAVAVLTAPLARADLFSEPPQIKAIDDQSTSDTNKAIDKINGKISDANQKLDHAYGVATQNASTYDAVVSAGGELDQAKQSYDDAGSVVTDAKNQVDSAKSQVNGIKCKFIEPISYILCGNATDTQKQTTLANLEQNRQKLQAKQDEIDHSKEAVATALAAVEAAKTSKMPISKTDSSSSSSDSSGSASSGSSSDSSGSTSSGSSSSATTPSSSSSSSS